MIPVRCDDCAIPTFWKLVLASLITLSLGYSAVTLGNRSFWLDELYTYAASDPQTPFATLLQDRILPDVHPPLYYLTAHLWAIVFGPSEVGYRSLSLSFAILTVPASLSLGRALCGRWGDGIAVAALIATSPAFLIYSQEARSYSMLLFASCTVYAATLWLIRALEVGKPHHFLLAFQSASMLVAGLTHYFGYFVSALAALGTLTFAWQHRRRLLPIVAAYGPPGLILTVWVTYHAIHLRTLIAGGHFWIESISSLSGTSQLITQTTALMLGIYGAGTVLCCCLYVLMRYAANVLTTVRQVNFLFMAGTAVGTVAAAVLLSLKVPVLTVRNLIVLLPPIAAVLYLLFRATPRIQPFLLCSICAVAFLAGAVEAQNIRKLPSWRGPAAVIANFPSCTNQPILVVRMGIRSPAMYLYYTGEVKPRFIDIDPELLVKGGGSLAGQIGDAFASPCPIKFWGAHLKRDQIEDLRAAFQMLAPDFYFIQWENGAGHLLVIDKSKSDSRPH